MDEFTFCLNYVFTGSISAQHNTHKSASQRREAIMVKKFWSGEVTVGQVRWP
jgi:hypothetical protein